MIKLPEFPRHEVVAVMMEVGLLPVFYHGDLKVAKKVSRACHEGGARAVEFTNRGDLAYQTFSELVKWSKEEFSDLILGAGTIVDPATAVLYIDSGANFIVSPILNPEIAKICNRRKVTYIPGCSTPSEISEAEEMGAEIIKVFPAKVVTPYLIKAVLAPCPWFKLMPSGGLKPTREDVSAWIKAGATVLNIGSRLISKDLVEVGNFEKIKERVRECVRFIKETRTT